MNSIATVRRGPARRLWNAIQAVYWRYRLNEAEQDLEGFRRELVNREKQMRVHEKFCGEVRAKLVDLGAL